ncbi:MAG: hypothetical protein U5R30_12430 [Deltaproteobacteria bacterium]|nr:hypothetical protein [Deltaproteobacteria bacterium]
MSATALPGYEFTGWSGPGAGNLENATLATTRIINPIYADTDITATFAKTTYTLTIAGGAGVDTLLPASGTNYVFDDGLAITATPAPGWEFVNWTGDVSNLVDANSASTTLVNPLMADTSVTANFARIEYTLTVNRTGGMGTGSVSVSPSQATYHYGDVVTITATAGTGEIFANWSGALTGSTNPETLTISGNHTVTANFAYIEYNLNITIDEPFAGGGTAVTKSPDKPTYHYGDTVILTAVPGTGELFGNWSGDATGNSNPTSILIDGDKSVTATFEKIPVTLTMQVVILDGGAFGTVTPDIGTYSYLWGDAIAVSATPNPNSAFSGWSPNVVGGVVTMNGDQTVTATFELKKFSVTFNAGAHGLVQDVSGTPTNSITQQVKWGTNSTVVSAVANEHYHFLNWSNTAGDIVSTVAGLQAIGVTQDLVFTANFEIDKFTVTFVSGTFGGIEVAGAPPQYYEDKYTEIVEWGGSSKWVTAKPDDQNQFRGWHGDYTSDDLVIQVTNVQQDMTVTYDTVPDISGCSTDVTAGYSGGFQATDFKRVNIDVDTVTGHMVLNTGNQGHRSEQHRDSVHPGRVRHVPVRGCRVFNSRTSATSSPARARAGPSTRSMRTSMTTITTAFSTAWGTETGTGLSTARTTRCF